MDYLQKSGLTSIVRSRTIRTRPIGPSQRQYANGAALIETNLEPPALLAQLKEVEQTFGWRRGQPGSRRVLDLDIILWSRGPHFSSRPALIIPHPEMRNRSFVLTPAAEISGNWRDPVTGLTIRQLNARLKRPKKRLGNRSKLLDPKANRH